MRYLRYSVFTTNWIEDLKDEGAIFRFELVPSETGDYRWILLADRAGETLLHVIHAKFQPRIFHTTNAIFKFWRVHFPEEPQLVIPMYPPDEEDASA